MVNILRLILTSVLLFIALAASASVPKVTQYVMPHPLSNGSSELISETAVGVCGQFKAAMDWPSGFVSGPISAGVSPQVCNFPYTNINVTPPSNSTYSIGYGSRLVCPAGTLPSGSVCEPDPDTQCTANSEKVNGVCMCKTGFKEGLGGCIFDNKGQCEAFAVIETQSGGVLVQDVELKGRVEHEAEFCMPLGSTAAGIANAGCKVAFSQTMVAENHDGSTTSYGKWNMSGTGDYSCDTSVPSPPKQPDKPKCNNGAPGTVNGVEVCVPRQGNNGVESGGKDSTTTDDGTNTTKKENNSTTVCKDGKCTTTTVTNTTITNNTSGNATTSTSTNTTTTSQGDFCAKNPKSAQCNGTGTGSGSSGGDGDGEGDKDPSEFGGACAGGFTCKGDAIQCSIAREQHARACKMFDDPSPESLLYQAEKGKEGNQADKLEGNEIIDMTGRIDTTDVFGGGSGVQDLQITVWGNSVSLPFSNLNGPLGIFGNLLVAVSFLIAARIVGRG